MFDRSGQALALALALVAAAAGGAARAEDGGWMLAVDGGGVFGSSEADLAEADVSGAWGGASVSRRIGSAWSVGLGVSSFRSETDLGSSPSGASLPTLEATGAGGTASLSWTGEAAFLTLSATLGSETQDLAPLTRLGALAQVRETEGTAYGGAIALGLDHGVGGWLVTPSVSAAYDRADYEPVVFQTQLLGEITRDLDFSTLSAEAALAATRSEGAVRPGFIAAVVYADGESDDLIAQRLAGRRLVAGGEQAAWAEAGAGLDIDLGPAAVLGLAARTSLGREGGETSSFGVTLSGSW